MREALRALERNRMSSDARRAGYLLEYRATTVAAPRSPGNSTHSPLNFFQGLPLTWTADKARQPGSRKRRRISLGGLRRGASSLAVIWLSPTLKTTLAGPK